MNLSAQSVLSLHALAPRAVHGCLDVVVPMLANGTLVADLAVDGVALDEREAGDDAGFPGHRPVVITFSWTATRRNVTRPRKPPPTPMLPRPVGREAKEQESATAQRVAARIWQEAASQISFALTFPCCNILKLGR